MIQNVQANIAGKALSIETGKLAFQANGAVVIHYGDTVVLVTANSSKEPREGDDFAPLTVDYEEKLYAAGKIPGGFFKREGRPGQEAILTSRLTDRPLRPLFPKGYRNEVQIIITVLSADQENDPDILAIIGASSALGLSDIPYATLIAASRIGYVDGQYLVNPTYSQLSNSVLDIIVASTFEDVIMVEAGAKGVSEEVILGAIRVAHETNKEVIKLQRELIEKCGKPKLEIKLEVKNSELESSIINGIGNRFTDVFSKTGHDQEKVLSAIKTELITSLEDKYSVKDVARYFDAAWRDALRRKISNSKVRLDGRNLTEIRPISCEVGVLPRPHGSGLFTRGATQVLTITTLGSKSEEQRINGLGQEESRRFMHHYNFPPFSVGEVKRIGTPGRREIGHGALAERALEPVIPSEEEFPYTIRLVSEVLSSNGSSSMASVCGSTLSLMDAGVPIKSPVAGIAMGLIKSDGDNYAILTDITGTEDHLGDMDFKVAGTDKGINALQMDIKIIGITDEIMGRALQQAKEARLFVLGKMSHTINSSRNELSKYAPRMIKMTISKEKIGNVIGPKGKTIRSIIEEAKVTIDISDDGTVIIGSVSEEGTQKAIKMIEDLTKEVEVGAIYTGKVTRITNFGAFVEIIPGKEGMVHVSKLADYRVANVEDVVKLGDEITVKVMEIDQMGRINLSRKDAFATSGSDPGSGKNPPAARQNDGSKPYNNRSDSFRPKPKYPRD